jgi:hypothetical protein
MKTKQTLIVISILLISSCFWSQEPSKQADSLNVIKKIGEFSFFHNGNEIPKSEYIELISSNPEANELFKKANNKAILASTFSFVGGFGIGWTIASFLRSDSPDQVNWWMGGIGVGSLLISIPIATSAMDIHLKAAKKFNSDAKSKLNTSQHSQLLFQVSPNRIGFQFNF